MAGVMGDHGPTGEGPGGQGEDGDEVDAQSHGQHANGGAGVRPADHLVQMTDVGLTLLLLKLLTEGLDVGRKCDDIEVLDPLVLLLELLGSATASGGDAAHDVCVVYNSKKEQRGVYRYRQREGVGTATKARPTRSCSYPVSCEREHQLTNCGENADKAFGG